jgi:hypothetical protein
MLWVEAEISVYQVDGKDAPVASDPLKIRKISNHSKLVEVEFQGKRITVSFADLRGALDACEQRGG